MNHDTHEEPSSLLRLPAELRLHIYTYVFSSPIPLSIYCWRCYAPFGFATRILQRPPGFLSLLRLNHQIYNETRLLPFQLNAFRFKSQDVFTGWFNKFSVEQLEGVREVELVTWMARHMVEGEAWVPKRVEDVFPVERLSGLRRVGVEVRFNRRDGDCVRGECWNCEGCGVGVVEEEGRLRAWFQGKVPGIQVMFERVAA